MTKRKRTRASRPERSDSRSIVRDPETGPYLYTFTFRIPFVLGVADDFGHDLTVPGHYGKAEDEQLFGRPPFVRVRIFNAEIPDHMFAPANLSMAIRHFYGADTNSGEPAGKHLYEQWVTLETPAVLLSHEQPSDPAYAFHRSIGAFNSFLEAFSLARDKGWVRPISTRELRPVVVIGNLSLEGTWTDRMPMLMHPDAEESPLTSRPVTQHMDELSLALDSIINDAPFIRAGQWRSRAERRKYEGDAADAIISFQIAAEVLLYELWGLLLMEEGVPTQEVSNKRSEQPFTTLLNRELAVRLGGSLDLTSRRAPVGRYWADLYKLRNRIVHGGYQPHDGDAEQAERAYRDLDGFIDERLKTKPKRYPQTLKAKMRKP